MVVDAPPLAGCPGERCVSRLRLSSSDHSQFCPLCISRIRCCSLFYTLPVSGLPSATLIIQRLRLVSADSSLSLRAGHRTAAGAVCPKPCAWNVWAAFPTRSHFPRDRHYPFMWPPAVLMWWKGAFLPRAGGRWHSSQSELLKWPPSCLWRSVTSRVDFFKAHSPGPVQAYVWVSLNLPPPLWLLWEWSSLCLILLLVQRQLVFGDSSEKVSRMNWPKQASDWLNLQYFLIIMFWQLASQYQWLNTH